MDIRGIIIKQSGRERLKRTAKEIRKGRNVG